MQGPVIHKMDEKLDKVIDALSVLAVQKNEIQHISKTQDDHRVWLKNHEERLQKVELQPGRMATKTLLIVIGAGVTVVSGVVVFMLTH